jgi:Domain of unknown function (DUF4336)
VLTPVHEDLHVVAHPHKMLGLSLGTRMTVVRLADGSLLLHSPIPIDEPLAKAIDALGEVAHVVCPNAYHHLYAADVMRRYPKALLHGPRQLFRKRRDLDFHAALEDGPTFGDDLIGVKIDGCLLYETVFVHLPSRTLVSVDLAENFTTAEDLYTRTYLKLGGVHGKIGWSRLLRPMYWRRKATRRSLDRLREHDFDRLILAHGNIVERDAKQAIADTFHFL